MDAKLHNRNKPTHTITRILLLIVIYTYFDIALAEVTITAVTAPDGDAVYYDNETSKYFHDGNMISLSGTAVEGTNKVEWECVSGCNGLGGASGTTSWSIGSFYLKEGSNNIEVKATHIDGSISTDSVNVYYTIPSGTDITLPYTLDFDSGFDSLDGLISATKGAVVTAEDSQCWRGGCAKFVPAEQNNSYAGIGGFNFPENPNRVHVRYLIFYGPDYLTNLQRRHKHILIHRGSDVSSDRGMIYAWKTIDGSGDLSLGACDNTDCRYEDGKDRPDGTESFLVADHLSEWISVEAVFDTEHHIVQLYVTTQDGTLFNHLLAQTNIHSIDNVSQDYWARISLIGGYMDWGTTASHGMYWLLDEVEMSSSYIGPPDGFVENSYVVVNPRLTSASVVSLADNNHITAGDTTLDLDLYERGAFYSTTEPVLHPGMVISGTGPFDLGSSTGGTDMPPHVSMLGTTFAMPHTRLSHSYHMVTFQDGARVNIEINGESHQVNLSSGVVETFDAGETNGTYGAVITSDAPILLSHSGGGHNDASPIPPAAAELWGIKTGNAYVIATEDDTHVTLYASGGTRTTTMTLDAGEKRYVNVGVNWDNARQGAGSAVHLVADKPISAVQQADGDGYEQTAFYPSHMLKQRFGIPKDSQYVAIVCSEPDTSITLYRPNSDPVTQTCSADGDYPGKVFFGRSDENIVDIRQGSYLESTRPIHVIYEPTGSNDEHNLMGASASL
jgi:hypothetical protein